jgi:transposase
MEVIHKQCAGLDCHSAMVQATARIQEGRNIGRVREQFGTTTPELLRLADWLTEHRCTHVIMEATGVYWKPIWHVLEAVGGFGLLLVRPNDVKAVTGRKSDENDADWLAELGAHGLVRGSFVPPQPIQDLRDLMRTRLHLVHERTHAVQRMQRELEDANIKLAEMISEIVGQSGRAVIEALVAGESEPKRLLALTSTRLKASPHDLLAALTGYVRPHHRFMLRVHLDHYDAVEALIQRIEAEVEEKLEPFRAALHLLMTIPAVKRIAAATLIAEIGVDMSVFPSSGHLLSWATLCPRLDESAGKKRSTRTRRGGTYLKPLLIQVAWAAVRRKDSYLHAQFLRIRSRRGNKKAIVAVAASILTAVHRMLTSGTTWNDLGADYFTRRDRKRLAATLKRRLENLGFSVDLKQVA